MAIRSFSGASIKTGTRRSKFWDQSTGNVIGSYDALATVIVPSGGLSSITFAGIPQTGYSHLQIRGLARSSGGASNTSIIFNNDNGNNYASHWLTGNGSSTTGTGSSTSRANLYVDITGANSSGAMWSADVIDILDYVNTNKNTTIRALAGQDFNSSGTTWLVGGVWLNTSAVNSITFTQNGVNFTEYSQFALYGVK
jgi:hypothetical protein